MDVFTGGGAKKFMLSLSSLIRFCENIMYSMFITIFMHVVDKLYASRINLNIKRLIIHKTKLTQS